MRRPLPLQHLFDCDLDRVAERREVVSPLEDEYRGTGGAVMEDAPHDAVDALVRDAYVGMRVVHVDVVSGGDEDDVRPEPVDDSRQDVLVDYKVVLVSRTLQNRHVVGKALAPAPATLHVPARLGIVRILMSAKVEDRVVLFEDMLRAIAVMGVEIDDEHAPVTDRLREAGADGDVVEDAEPHASVHPGVVPGRAHGAEGAPDLPLIAAVDGLDDRSGSVERRLEGALREVSVGVELSPAHGPDLFDVFAAVDAGQVFKSRPPRGYQGKPWPKVRSLESCDDVDETVAGIGMPGRRSVAQEDVIVDESDFLYGDRHRFTLTLALRSIASGT